MRRADILFIALGIGAALLVVAYKLWAEGVDMTVWMCRRGPCRHTVNETFHP